MEKQPTITDLERAYGDSWAPYYDQIFHYVDPSALDFLAGLAGADSRALELAVGTGRVAIPLAERGVEVTGIDLSGEMLKQLAAKQDGDLVTAVFGDMVEVPVDGMFSLVFVAFNSLFAISSQERQVECFSNVASHLESGGHFVIECFVPDMKRFDANHRHQSDLTHERSGVIETDLAVHYPHVQRVDSHITTRFPDGSTRTLPVSIRYAWPAELDLMAQLAGLVLESRFEWYDESPFTADSGRHVSVYRKP